MRDPGRDESDVVHVPWPSSSLPLPVSCENNVTDIIADPAHTGSGETNVRVETPPVREESGRPERNRRMPERLSDYEM